MLDQSVSGAKQFADDLGLTFPILLDERLALSDWQVVGLPTTYLVDTKGQIVAKAVGDRQWDSPAMMQRLESYLDNE